MSDCIAQQSTKTPFVGWTSNEGSQLMYKRNVMVNKGHFSYVGGATLNVNGHYDMIIEKSNTMERTILWTRTLNGGGTGDNAVSGIAVDNGNNVYVCGTLFIDSTNFNDMALVKYNASGVLQWKKTFNYTGSSYDGATAIVLDNAAQRICITGTGYNSNNDLDFVTLCYDFSGNLQWQQSFDQGNNGVAAKVIFAYNTFYITGAVEGSNYLWKTAIVKYDESTGTQGATACSGGGSYTADIVGNFYEDNAGNLYITGSRYTTGNAYDIYTVKYDTLLNNVWSDSLDGGSHQNDYGSDVIVKGNGDVFVTGAITNASGNEDLCLIKYNANGTQAWVQQWNNANGNGNDSAAAITIDGAGKIFVAGKTWNGSNYDYIMLKYDTDGTNEWNITYNGLADGNDITTAIAPSDTDNAMVMTGTSMGDDSNLSYLTLDVKEMDVPNSKDTLTEPISRSYTQNRGQLLNTDSNIAQRVKYYTETGSHAMYFMDDTISYVWAKIDTAAGANDTLQRVDMYFIRPNSGMQVRALEKQSYYTNYFLGYLPKMRTDVPHYSKLYYNNVWDSIDVKCSANSSGFMYYFIVKPGGDTSHIQWNYTGQDSVKIDTAGNLIIYSSIGKTVYAPPRAWQVDASGTVSTVSWTPNYQISGSSVTLNLGSYNTSKNLVIAVGGKAGTAKNGGNNLLWSSFFRGNGTISKFTDVKTDGGGNVYYCGYTNDKNFPTNAGQTASSTFWGNKDALLVKLDAGLTLQYTTFFGGASPNGTASGIRATTVANALYIRGFIYMVGASNVTDMPLVNTSNGYQDTSNTASDTTGNNDMIITKFRTNGTLLWSTYYGADSDEVATDDVVDNWGNLYVVGQAKANTPPQSLAGASNYSVGNGFVLKFDNTETLKWGSFWGNPNVVGAVEGVACDDSNNVFIAGWTGAGTSMPTYNTDPNVPSTTAFNGGCPTGYVNIREAADAYVAKFNADDSLAFSMYYGGDLGDAASGIAVSDSGDVYITGQTSSTNGCGFPLLDYDNGSTLDFFNAKLDQLLVNNYNCSGVPGADAFILELSNNGRFKWSTYFGGNSFENTFFSDWAGKITVDKNGYIYAYGDSYKFTIDIQMPSSTPGNVYLKATNPSAGHAQSTFIAAFNPHHDLVWSTYFGSYGQDDAGGITTLHTSSYDRLYICGATSRAYDSINTNFPIGYDSTVFPNAIIQSNFGNDSVITDAFGSIFDLTPIYEISAGIKNNKPTPINNISAYPNPFHGGITITTQGDGTYTATLYDVAGKLILSKMFHQQRFLFDTGKLPKGVYILKVKGLKMEQVFKMVH